MPASLRDRRGATNPRSFVLIAVSIHPMLRVLYLEPFEGGSHAAFTRILTRRVHADWTVCTLPGHHWKWRMRGAVPYWALAAQDILTRPYDLVWASAYVPLAELVGLVPALSRLPKVLYFHENQLAYPQQGEARERDHHYGVTQLISGLAADRLLFNSRATKDSRPRETKPRARARGRGSDRVAVVTAMSTPPRSGATTRDVARSSARAEVARTITALAMPKARPARRMGRR